ncbi:conserved protein of unknown function [Petrocella atlantisensis]|uniref:SH3b domain-containing protein n=1 Tax=Petrocella atlantisensis TaxID=2173034 RepID=A0A3P7S059_9FIRM|nr:SH3 domain-containing protein [Petrocella atlantisensis]VDN48132.1 conserved protein of unknown function [Petrocella atlantisensis]
MNITDKRNIVKSFVLIMVFLFLSGCRPIEGLEPNDGLSEPKDGPVVIEEAPVEEPEMIPEPEKTDILHVQIIADVLNVRESASINSTIVDKVQENAIFEVLEEAMDDEDQIWYKIKTEKDVLGWIFGAYCVSVEEEDLPVTTDE